MTLAGFIKVVGRGAAGAQALTREQSREAFGQLLDAPAHGAEAGAFLMAMRMKGESLDELCGFLDAAHARCLTLPCDEPVVLLPSPNGARRLPLLTPLLALLLARQGLHVLVTTPETHPAEEARRLTTPALLAALGLPLGREPSDIARAWRRGEPAFTTLQTVCPGLQRVLDLRWAIGVRGPGHSVAKMLRPLAPDVPALRVVNHTHPEFGALMRAWAERERADAMLLRGLEGEPVADPRKPGTASTLLAGIEQGDLGLAAAPASPAMPALPTSPALVASGNAPGDAPDRPDPGPSARYTEAVLSGAEPLPGPLRRQVEVLVAATRRLLPAPVQPPHPGLRPPARERCT
jgi:anthranilate phosphoribosyltransferase